jgi:hypothetical protein
MSSETLDDIFSNTEAEAVVEPEAEETAEETTTEEPEQEAEADKEEESTESATAADADDDKTEWTKKMALDERRKRQELERRYAELEAKVKAPEGKDESVDFFADPDRALGQVKNEIRSELANAKLEISQELMRERFEDYDELESEFVDLAKDNPVLLKQLSEAKNPAKFAYETAQKARKASELDNVDTYREKIRAEEREKIRAELEAEFKQTAEKAQKRDKALAPSLANQRAAGALDEVATETLDDIFRGK